MGEKIRKVQDELGVEIRELEDARAMYVATLRENTRKPHQSKK